MMAEAARDAMALERIEAIAPSRDIAAQCTVGQWTKGITRARKRLDKDPTQLAVRSMTVEHPYGTIKLWMGATHFRMRRLKNVATEMALHVLAYNMTRVMKIMGIPAPVAAMKA